MIPTVDGKTLKKIDERAESEYGISLLQLMEVAGSRMAEFFRSQIRNIAESEILVICGKGNNGGDGFVMARVLHNWGAKVKIYLSFDKKQYKGIPLVNLETCEKLGIEFIDSIEGEQPNIIADCMFGFGFKGELRKFSGLNLFAQPQNSFDFVKSCTCTSRPIMVV